VPIPPRRQAYHAGMQIAKACSRGTCRA
jgi:hypothetical protein